MRFHLRPERLALPLTLLIAAAVLAPQNLFNRVSAQSDIVLHYTWSEQFARSLHQGHLYPRWLPDEKLGLGDPTFVHYPPLYSALVALVSFTGIGIWNSMKMVELCALWLAGLFAYRLLRRWLPPGWALAGAATLQISPFLAALVTNFNARPWFIATPVFLAALLFALDEERVLDLRLATAFFLLVLTHILTALMAAICIPALAFRAPREWSAEPSVRIRGLARIAISAAAGILLAGFYLVPALLGIPNVSPRNWENGVLDWHGAFVFPLWTARHFPVRWFAFQWIVPAAALAITAALAMHAWTLRKELSPRAGAIFGMTWICLLSLFLSCELSYPVWMLSHTLQRIQFPYRFTYVQMLCGILGGCLCVGYGRVWTRRLAFAIPVVLSLLLTPVVLRRNLTEQMPDYVQSQIACGIHGAPEYLPAHAPDDWSRFARSGGIAVECAVRDLACHEIATSMVSRSWRIRSARDVDLDLPVFFYPAWKLRVDGAESPARYDPATGLIPVKLRAGDHRVAVLWDSLPYARAGVLCSLVTLLLCLAVARPSRPVRFLSPNDHASESDPRCRKVCPRAS
jgi:hypothetical protein